MNIDYLKAQQAYSPPTLEEIIRQQQEQLNTCRESKKEDLAEIYSLKAEIEALKDTLDSIDVYLSDTLSGRTEPDPSTEKQWLIESIREARNRARAILRKAQENEHR